MSIATELTRIQTAKANLKTQIEAKGVSVPSTATIDTYATYVQAIPQGGGGGGTDYFKITNRTATAGTITFTLSGSVYNLKLKMSSDGTNWTNYDMSATTTVVLPANGYIMIDGSENTAWSYGSSYKRWQISADVDHNISGKISTLVGRSMTPTFSYIFFKDTQLVDASNLILNYDILNSSAYNSMFEGCTSLTTAPALPATTLASNCYASMFNGCTSLTTAPALPATTLASNCYVRMFEGCTSLTTAPALPATTMTEGCYANMFDGCTSLTTAPELPASALAQTCYYYMFNGCTSLTTAPVLSAAALKVSCYAYMFAGCTSLTSITCLAMTTMTNATGNWVRGIATTGTLYVASGTSINWTQGNNGYPSTWTLQTYTP